MALRPKGDTIVDPTNRRVSRITHMQERVYTRYSSFLSLSFFLALFFFFYLSAWLVSSFFVDGDSLFIMHINLRLMGDTVPTGRICGLIGTLLIYTYIYIYTDGF